MRSLSPSLILVCTLTVSPTRNAGTWARLSCFTFRSSTSSIAFARIAHFSFENPLQCKGVRDSTKNGPPSRIGWGLFDQPQVFRGEPHLAEEARPPGTAPPQGLLPSVP